AIRPIIRNNRYAMRRSSPPAEVIRMFKARGDGRSKPTLSLGVECLEGRVVLSGSTHHAAVTASAASTHAANAAATVAEAALLPPVVVKSYMLRHGHMVTGLVMDFSK